MVEYELWNKQDGDDWAVLVRDDEKVRGFYNDEGLVTLDICKEEFLRKCEIARNSVELAEGASWLKFALFLGGQIPEHLFSNDKKIVVNHFNAVFENYEEMMMGWGYDTECIFEGGKVAMWKPQFAIDEEICPVTEFFSIDTKEQQNKTHEYYHALKTTENKILVRLHSNFLHNGNPTLDKGKLMTKREFDEFCKENEFDNPWQLECDVERFLNKFAKGEVQFDSIDWDEKTICVLLPYSPSPIEFEFEGETLEEIIEEFYGEVSMSLESMVDHIELVREHFLQTKEEEEDEG